MNWRVKGIVQGVLSVTPGGRFVKFWDNDVLYQNRLRPHDFVRLGERVGLKTRFARSESVLEVHKRFLEIELSSESRAYPPEELCAVPIGLLSQAC